ncbi:CAAX amino terminal protease [Trinorchestia longiramus]|nr:CAAX amino terminal protease [Trinorchestia longiramus]
MVPCWAAVLLCVLLSVLYVASLYVWDVWDASKGRDHPSTIKKRCISVAFMTLLSPVFVKFTVNPEAFLQYNYPSSADVPFRLHEVMGLRLAGLGFAVGLPLLLTATLFSGPIIYYVMHEHNVIYMDPRYWYQQVTSMVWLRNQVVAPFSEEWTFRACLIPMLVQYMKPTTTLFVAPLFFGIAHIHHAIERLRIGIPVIPVVLGTVFQCIFTSVFGMYSAYLFMKTGHFVSAFIAHAFCNQMGMPDVVEILNLPMRQRVLHLGLHVFGIALWFLLLPSLTASCRFQTVVHYLPDL